MMTDHKASGNAAFSAGKFDEAVKHFTEGIEAGGEELHVLFSNRSGAYAKLSQYDKAIDDANECIKLKKDWAKGYSRKALAQFNMGMLEKAEETYREGLRHNPKNESLLDGLQQVTKQNESMDDTQAQIFALQVCQKNSKLMQYAKEDSSYIKTLAEIIKGIQKSPNSLQTFLMHPDVRVKEGLMAALGIETPKDDTEPPPPPSKKQEDRKVDNRSQEEKEADEWKSKGNEFYKKKEFEKALEAYDNASRIYPKQLLYNNNKAAVYLEMQEYEKCLAECDDALSRKESVQAEFSTVAKLLTRKAVCYTRMKNFQSAIDMYQQSLLEVNDRNVRVSLNDTIRLKEKAEKEAFYDADKAEEHRQKGNDLYNEARYPEAKKEYDIAIRRNPNDSRLYNNRAATFMKLLEYPSALADCDKTLSIDPKNVKGWIRKGKLHTLIKEYTKALGAFDSALKHDPQNMEATDGKVQVMMKIHQQQSSGTVDEEQMRHSMADPEIQEILRDPQMNLLLQQLQEDPSAIKDYIQDPKIKDALTKLMAAGILRMA